MTKKPSMTDEFWQRLADNNPIGMQLTSDDARAWFDLVWLRYDTYGYKRHARAIISWWSRVREEEIYRARERWDYIRNDDENARLEQHAEESAEEANVTRIDHFARLRANG